MAVSETVVFSKNFGFLYFAQDFRGKSYVIGWITYLL